MRCDVIAGAHPRVNSHALGPDQTEHSTSCRQKTLGGVFGTQPCLDRVTLNPDLGLREWQRLTRCNSKLPLDQIESRNHFGDRMLDLQSRVHFHKIETLGATAFITGDQKFDGSGADIIDRPRGSNGRLPERIA